MFLFLAVLTTFSALTMLIAGSLSLIRNPSKLEHRWFFVLTLALAVWVPANFIDSNVVRPGLTLPLVKVDYSFALLLMWLLLAFVVALVQNGNYRVRKKAYLAQKPVFLVTTGAFNLLLIAGIFSGRLLHASITNDGLSITTSTLFWAYVATLIFYFVYALAVLGSTYLRLPHKKRQGLDLIWVGFFIATAANIATNLIFPSVIETRSVVKGLNIIGYIGILLLVGCVYTAITVRKLFDLRLVVARSLAYVLLIVFVGALYAGISTGLSILITGTHASFALIVTNVILTFFVAITFGYIKNFFDRVTARIFFRDSYDLQAVINNLTAITTSTLDIASLAKNSLTLLEETLKSSYCVLALINDQEKYRLFGTSRAPNTLSKYAAEIKKMLKPRTPLSTSFLNNDVMKGHLNSMQVELIVPLYANKTFIGFMAFGTKQNGIIYSQQDMQLLTIAADSLAVASQNALRFEEIESFNRTLQAKVDDATRKLRRTNEKLKALDETKDDFISMASHQLRTPLTSVKGYISMVMEGDAGKVSPTQQDMLNQAFFSSQRMVYLISDLLNVSRLKTGKFVIEPTRVNLAKMVEQELDQLKEAASARSLTLTYDPPENFPDVMLDETKTRQVVMNFADNAIYYTPAGGHVTVRLVDTPTTVEFRVEDNGIGVAKSDQPHLFTKFYRAGNARKARPDGTGLGLFMAKKVIAAEEGSLIFNSEEGKGSTFGFVFSKSKVGIHDGAQTAPVEEPEVVTTK